MVAERRGSPCDPSFFLPKALWLLHHRPDGYGRARWLFSCPEYVSFILTGEAVTFLPTPDYTRTVMWDAETVRSLGMDPGKFPPFIASGAAMGTVTEAGEAATGVLPGPPAGVRRALGGNEPAVTTGSGHWASTPPFVAMTCRYQPALFFHVRACVAKSTCVMPKRLLVPNPHSKLSSSDHRK
jgi:hypothetical protein